MTLEPDNLDQLKDQLLQCRKDGDRVTTIRMDRLNRCLEHQAGDMITTVEAGITLKALQKRLAEKGQWLPIDPFPFRNDSIGAHLALNRFGPRRHGYGTLKDYLIGIKVMTPDGNLVHSGGKVVKNVAGFDLARLFIGSEGSLGVICEATFKLLPLPEKEVLLLENFESLDMAFTRVEKILSSGLRPICLDILLNDNQTRILVGFAGHEEEVNWQLKELSLSGWNETHTMPISILDLWNELGLQTENRSPVLPSEILKKVKVNPITRAWIHTGSGVIRHDSESKKEMPHLALTRRMRDVFDPDRIMPDPGFLQKGQE